jgi:hypothetical protein
MSKETVKMRKIRIERIALKKAVRESEQLIVAKRNEIQEAWPHRDTNKEAMKAIRKCGRIIGRERENLRAYRSMLKSTKHEIRKLNRQHDFRFTAVREHQVAMAEAYPKTSLLG